MNKLKVAIQELQDHLGRDSHGTLLLRKVTVIANDQRTRCASLESEAAEARASAEMLQNKLATAEARFTAVQEELRHEKAKRAAAESREKIVANKIKAMQGPVELAGQEGFEDGILSLLAKVQKRFKKLPVLGAGKSGGLVVEDFIKSFAYDEFAGLGMVMAACAIMNTPLNLRCERPICVSEQLSEEQLQKLIQWFSGAIYISPIEKRVGSPLSYEPRLR